MSAVDHVQFHTVLAKATNKRQAAKILDVKLWALLVCKKPTGQVVYVGNCEHGCHAIWLQSRTYCDDRHISLPQLSGIVRDFPTIDVDHKPPQQIRVIIRSCGGE